MVQDRIGEERRLGREANSENKVATDRVVDRTLKAVDRPYRQQVEKKKPDLRFSTARRRSRQALWPVDSPRPKT